MMKKKHSRIDAFLALPDEEKERQFKEFDAEFVADTFGPLKAAQRKLWAKAKARNVGRSRNGTKRYTSMTTAELRAATKEYDIPSKSNPLPGRALTAAQRKMWEKAKGRGRGRPRVGNGVKVISLSVEKGLLEKVDAAAKTQGISRAELFARGVRSVLPVGRGARVRNAARN